MPPPSEVPDLAGVDWSAPWLAPLREQGLRASAALGRGQTVPQALNLEVDALDALGAAPRLASGRLRFVPQARLPAGQAYESFIAEHAAVPTRDNLHDLFNGLVWLRWPRVKRHLNQLQAEQLTGAHPGSARGAVRDALTLFDENAALLQLPPILEAALRQRDWHALFVARRAAWDAADIRLFGHALLDKLVRPRKSITAHAWLLPPGLADEPMQDWLIEHLTPQRLASRSHHPLPVLGVPGWWPANQAAGFYADAAVFRVARSDQRLPDR